MVMDFLKHRKIYFAFSSLLILASIVALLIFGLKPGIDFTGGSILEVEYKEQRPEVNEIKDQIKDLDLGDVNAQTIGDSGIILRMKDITEDTHQQILEKLGQEQVEEKRFESIGPIIGEELKQKTKVLVVLSLLLIVAYIAFAFRKVSRPCRSWQYGTVSLLALFHDVLIPLGVFAVLGRFYSVEISIPVIIGLLTVIGYSINNTVVVFDRIRENLIRGEGDTFEQTVNHSLNQTLTRSINTSLTTLFALLAIFFLGGETLRYFSLALIMGILAGTYSSIFLTSPVLVTYLKWRGRT